MTNTYRALSPQVEAMFSPGVFEADFSVMDEKDHIDNGLVELVPRNYRILSNNFSGGPQNSEWMGALRTENEAALISGGHIERIDAEVGASSTFKDLTADGGGAAPVDDAPQDKKTK